MRHTPTFNSWKNMITRCRYRNRKSAKNYALKGISVCDRWLVFENFLNDMGERPEGTSIDRINSNGNYEPENCRWSDSRTQSRNKTNNVLTKEEALDVYLLGLMGYQLSDIAKVYGISESLPREIFKGRTWPDVASQAMKMQASDSETTRLKQKMVGYRTRQEGIIIPPRLGENASCVKLTSEEVGIIKSIPNQFGRAVRLGKYFNVKPATITAIWIGANWSHLQPSEDHRIKANLIIKEIGLDKVTRSSIRRARRICGGKIVCKEKGADK